MNSRVLWPRVVLLLAALAGATLMLWTALGRWELPVVGPAQPDYYNRLVAGFRKGTVALDLEVPEALKQLPNPWDASKRPPDLAPHDVSYYRGHYYLYFGVVPAVVLFWPFKVLTGYDLPFVWSAIFFGVGAYLLSAWLWLRLVRDQFPRASLVTKLAGVAALGLVGGQLVLERRVAMWEVPIEGGHFFMVAFLGGAYFALRSPRNWRWLAVAGAALGLAVGCRPTLIAAGPALALLTLAVATRGFAEGWSRGLVRRWSAAILAAGLPLGVILAGLFAYNYARFGNPFEFGTIYQLSGGYDYRQRHFSLSFLPYNAFVYFLSSPQWGRYFPFVHPIASRPRPAGYYGIEYVYGALVVCPLVWGAVLTPLGFRDGRTNAGRVLFLWVVTLVAVANTLLLLCFNVAAARYVADFLPWWIWFALLGWATAEERWAVAPGERRFLLGGLRAVLGVAAVVSCALAFCASAEVHGVFRFSNPTGYAAAARLFDTPVAWWERLTGYRGGALEMTVTFPEQPSGSVEPLLVTGVSYQKDYVYIFYTNSRTLQLGYRSLEHPPIQSELLTVVPGRPYRLHVESGALFPPEGHPFYAGWTAPEVRALIHWTKITLDGRAVFNQSCPANEASPGSLRIGWDGPTPALYGARFTGTISGVVRSGIQQPQLTPPRSGDIWLDLTFPAEGPSGWQPLVVAGESAHADALGLRMVDPGHYLLAEEVWGGGLAESGILAVPPGREARLRVRLGPLLAVAESSPLALLTHTLVVWNGSTPVWWRVTSASLRPKASVSIGENLIGSSVMALNFEGRMNRVEPGAPVPAWRPGPMAAVALTLGGRGVGAEPLLSTGATGQDDLLEIEWLPGDSARLSYSHARKLWTQSPVFSWPASEVHQLQIALPSLPALDAPGALSEGNGPLRIAYDGREIWSRDVPCNLGAKSGSVAVGGYPSSVKTTTSQLTSAVLDLRQISPLISR